MYYLFIDGTSDTMCERKEPLEQMAESLKDESKELVIAEHLGALEPYFLQVVKGHAELKVPDKDAPNFDDKEQSKAQQLTAFDSQYEQDKKTLQGYYLDFMLAGDTEGMESIKAELEALTAQYDSDIEALKGGEE